MIEICMGFLVKKSPVKAAKQVGKPTYYNRRTPESSKLDINKTIKQLFNQLRVASNEEFPAFFCYKGFKYTLKITKERKLKR